MSVSKSKSIINSKLREYESIKNLLVNNKGYIGKFTEYIFCENVDYKSLEITFYELISLKNKSVNIDINQYKYEGLCDRIINENNILKSNKIIAEMPNNIKNILRMDLNKYMNRLLLLYNNENKKNFISKVSRYKDKDSFIDALDIFLKDSNNNKEFILEKVNNLSDSKVVYDDNNILIVHILKRRDMVELGSDTSWCIVNSDYNWNHYTKGGASQYIMFNYNIDIYEKDFKTGFTISYDGSITASHNIMDGWNKDYLLSVLNVHSINMEKIASENEIPIDVKKIKLNKKTSYDNMKKYVKYCDDDCLVDTINNIIKFDRCDHKRIRNILTIALERLYPGDDIIDPCEYNKFNKELIKIFTPVYTPFAKRIVSTDINNIRYMGDDRIKYLLDKYDFGNLSYSNVQNFLDYSYIKISNDVKGMLFDKALDYYKNVLSKEYEFESQLKNYRMVVLLLSKYSKNGLDIYDEIIDGIDYDLMIDNLKYFKEGFKFKLKPNKYGEIYYNKDIKYIIPDDYNNLLINLNNIKSMANLADSLIDNNLKFIIYETDLRRILNHKYNYYYNLEQDRLWKAFKSIKKNSKFVVYENIYVEVRV